MNTIDSKLMHKLVDLEIFDGEATIARVGIVDHVSEGFIFVSTSLGGMQVRPHAIVKILVSA